MSLTAGTGPFGERPAGRFNFDPPADVVYVEPFPRRIRAVRDGQTVVDCDRALLVHETGQLPRYALHADDVRIPGEREPNADGYVTVAWDAVDFWYEEDERVEVHPRDPYHRIDTSNTARKVEVSLDGVVLAESKEAKALYETGLPTRWYLPLQDVRSGFLEPSGTVTRCAYKGTARHWNARMGERVERDIAWCYDAVRREGEAVRGLIAFYSERVEIHVDGIRQEGP